VRIADIATQAGYTDPAMISKILNGQINPQLKTMLILDEALQNLVEGK
jgi:predicted transcriptional regulator